MTDLNSTGLEVYEKFKILSVAQRLGDDDGVVTELMNLADTDGDGDVSLDECF